MVQQILDKSFDVLVLDFGVIKRVYCDVSTGVHYISISSVSYCKYSSLPVQ